MSGRSLCDELITRPMESYRLWCVVVCNLETTKILVNKEEAKAHKGAIAPREKKKPISLLFFTARDEVYKSSWFAYESLGFIMDKTKPRQTLNTVSKTHHKFQCL